MGLIVIAGLQISASHVLVGLLLTPFFGAGPYWWAHVIFNLLLALGAAPLFALAPIPARFHSHRLALSYFLAGNLLLLGLPLCLAPLTRLILSWNPDSILAPALSLGLFLLPASVFLGAAVPALAKGPRSSARQSFSGRGLIYFWLGLLSGAVLAIPPLLFVNQVHAPLVLLGLACFGLMAFARELHGWRRWGAASLTALVSLISLLAPNELDSLAYRSALEQGFRLRLGEYYLATAGQRSLANSEILKAWEQTLASMSGREDPVAAAVQAIARTLANLGAVETSGDALIGTLRPLLSENARRYVIPFLEPFDTISSDGKGRLLLVLKPGFKRKVLYSPLAARADESVTTFVLENDLILDVSVAGAITEARFGPHEVMPRGFFELYESHRSPLRIMNVAAFVDAWVLSLTIEDGRKVVLLRARAQASVGPVVERELFAIPKHR